MPDLFSGWAFICWKKMGNMRFLKDNRHIFYIMATLPLFFVYLDRTMLLWMRGLHAENTLFYSFLRYADIIIDFIGHGATLIGAAFILYVTGRYFKRGLYHVGRSLFAGLVSAGVSVQVLKHFIGRARPRLTYDCIFIGPSLKSGYDSFPSGHTAIVFCLAYILSRYFPRYRVLFYFFAVLVSFERVEDLAHFPSDVMAGAMVGIIVGNIILLKTCYESGDDAREI
jgi:membrane-associated phospholipid phosphatase